MTISDDKKALEKSVNSAAAAIKGVSRMARDTRSAITAETAKKVSNYLRILVSDLSEELARIAAHNVPPPGEFSLDADIPDAPTPSIPSKPVYREVEPEGRLVGQRKAATPKDEDDVSFIDD